MAIIRPAVSMLSGLTYTDSAILIGSVAVIIMALKKEAHDIHDHSGIFYCYPWLSGLLSFVHSFSTNHHDSAPNR
ncbi:hypothetical protein F4778DRAFT_735561 [Xylariomycetidae sp. FL2044]|nr:hypothetical protein F4778DRAFT_735561 [Xylariomycetidae sp. FL2044]